jgi:hypothetical protein
MSRGRGLRRRLLLIPCILTCAVVAWVVILELADTYRVRSHIAISDHMVVCSGAVYLPGPEEQRILFETRDPGVIQEFAERITLNLSVPGLACRCGGSITFQFYRGREFHYSFSLQHGTAIRIRGSSFGDKDLTPSCRRSLKTWLDSTGVLAALPGIMDEDAGEK